MHAELAVQAAALPPSRLQPGSSWRSAHNLPLRLAPRASAFPTPATVCGFHLLIFWTSQQGSGPARARCLGLRSVVRGKEPGQPRPRWGV